jgi:hypothetical protein
MAKILTFETKQGLSGAVVTELTDVESEIDGFITFDRALVKMPVERVKAVNQKVFNDASWISAKMIRQNWPWNTVIFCVYE